MEYLVGGLAGVFVGTIVGIVIEKNNRKPIEDALVAAHKTISDGQALISRISTRGGG